MAGTFKDMEAAVRGIAEELDMGMVCFLNPDTLEMESVPGPSYGSYENGDFEEYYREAYGKADCWKDCVRIDPPETWESFEIMDGFIRECVPDNAPVGEQLWHAIAGRKPFRNFKRIIDGSVYRQDWFDFKQSRLERMVADVLEHAADGI